MFMCTRKHTDEVGSRKFCQHFCPHIPPHTHGHTLTNHKYILSHLMNRSRCGGG